MNHMMTIPIKVEDASLIIQKIPLNQYFIQKSMSVFSS